jgi:hypothetical protein
MDVRIALEHLGGISAEDFPDFGLVLGIGTPVAASWAP